MVGAFLVVRARAWVGRAATIVTEPGCGATRRWAGGRCAVSVARVRSDLADPEPDLVPGLSDEPQEDPRPPTGPRWPGVVLVLTLLLLAAAVTMAVAAAFLLRPQTWESSAGVSFLPTDAPATTPIATRVEQVRAAVPFLTGPVTERAQVPVENVRGDLAVRNLAYDELLVTARAASAAEAEQLARVAVVLVVERQQNGLTAQPSRTASAAVRTAPTLTDGLVTGGLAAAGLVVLVLTVRHVRGTQSL